MTTRGKATEALLHGSWTGLRRQGGLQSMRPHRGLWGGSHHPEREKGIRKEVCMSSWCPSAAGWGICVKRALKGSSGLGLTVYRALSFHYVTAVSWDFVAYAKQTGSEQLKFESGFWSNESQTAMNTQRPSQAHLHNSEMLLLLLKLRFSLSVVNNSERRYLILLLIVC